MRIFTLFGLILHFGITVSLYAAPLVSETDVSLTTLIAAHPTVFGPKTRLLADRRSGNALQVTLSQDFLPLTADLARVEQVVQLLATRMGDATQLHVFIDTPNGPRALDDFVKQPSPTTFVNPPAPLPSLEAVPEQAAFPFSGGLSGKRIVVSPGHGWYWVESLGDWYTQRPLINGIIEDFTNWRMAAHVITAFEHAGAEVYSCRERDRNTTEIIVDDETGAPAYQDGPEWQTSDYTGFVGDTYRFTYTSSEDGAWAWWRPDFPKTDDYAVYLAFRSGENRVTDAHYIIRHAGGDSRITVNQEINSLRWLYIGTYRFREGSAYGEGVALSPQSDQDGAVIADAVKFGGGMGSLSRDGATSNKPRWEEAARYWVEFVGAPPEAYNSTMEDNSGDVTARPKYANWQGADAYISLHSNAAGSPNLGYGTDTFMYNGDATEGSETWRGLVHEHVVTAIRSEWDPTWTDRGVKSANFGELRELASMPGCLIEVGFHDTEYDSVFLRRPPFRETVARAIVKAAYDFFDVPAPLYPLPVRNLRALPATPGVLRLMWEPTSDRTWGTETAPDHYRIYLSEGGQGFDNGLVTTAETHYDFNDLEAGSLYAFKVAAVNAGGESLASEPVAVRLQGSDFPQILIVNGFNRLDRSVQEEENTGEYGLIHAADIAAGGDYYFVSASDEAVEQGLVDLTPFDLVDWIAGEEAMLPGEPATYRSFSSAARTQLQTYLAAGGALFVSGSEIGWDMAVSAEGEADYLAFYTDTLKAAYVADDADTYSLSGTVDGLFDGMTFGFDDGSHGIYDVDWPDVISPATDSGATLCLTYETPSKGAGICAPDLVYLGIPFETLQPPDTRREVMQRILGHLTSEGNPPVVPDGDADSELDGDWEYDTDFEAWPDGDFEYTEFVETDAKTPIDDFPLPDGDVGPNDETDPPDGDVNGETDGDGTDEPTTPSSCLPGYSLQGDRCVQDQAEGSDGCRNTGGNGPDIGLALLLALMVWLRRRSNSKSDSCFS